MESIRREGTQPLFLSQEIFESPTDPRNIKKKENRKRHALIPLTRATK
jgi:ribosomal protein S21